MKTQQQLTDRCTPEIIKKMVELAEGFEITSSGDSVRIKYCEYSIKVFQFIHSIHFPFLIHRAADGWNKKYPEHTIHIWGEGIECFSDSDDYPMTLNFKNYQPDSLTALECTLLDCLLDILEEK